MTDRRIAAVGGDHAGYWLKKEIIEYLSEIGWECRDFGTYGVESVDYPVYARKVADAVLSGECWPGILVCGTGIGVSITANRINGIRAALCHDVYSARLTRLHNDANVLAIGGRVIGTGLALEIVKVFLETEFSYGENHVRRVGMLDSK